MGVCFEVADSTAKQDSFKTDKSKFFCFWLYNIDNTDRDKYRFGCCQFFMLLGFEFKN